MGRGERFAGVPVCAILTLCSNHGPLEGHGSYPSIVAFYIIVFLFLLSLFFSKNVLFFDTAAKISQEPFIGLT